MKLTIKTYSTVCILLKRSEYPVLHQDCIYSDWLLQFMVIIRIHHHVAKDRFSLDMVLCSIREPCAINLPLLDLHSFIVGWWIFSDQPVNMKKVHQQVLCGRTQKQDHKQQGAMSLFFFLFETKLFILAFILLLWDSSHQPNSLLELYGNKIKIYWKKSQLKEDKWKTKGESSLLERKGQTLVMERNWDIWYILLNET